MQRYIVGEKAVGETPLVALERLRKEHGMPQSIPLAYAGRLDPMASGRLLILVGDECKVQERYHSLDKEYEVEVLLGARSDTGDVLGLIETCTQVGVEEHRVRAVLRHFQGHIALPYPHFSSKTVKGKPLHTWTLEGRLGEIEIPLKRSMIYKLTLTGSWRIKVAELLRTVRAKIETIPPVTDPRKALGEDFRRDLVRTSWERFEKTADETHQMLRFTCICTSGTYMRSLSEEIAKHLGTCGLAYSIHRKRIGRYRRITSGWGIWTTIY